METLKLGKGRAAGGCRRAVMGAPGTSQPVQVILMVLELLAQG